MDTRLIIKWNKKAIRQLDEAVEYIEKDLPDNAKKIKKEILLKIDALPKLPERYAPNKYKTINDHGYSHYIKN